ncbi:MAG TPA: SHOCT domain-containing protein [Methanomassiliicoccales archaeon]|nr:SHOCT domain-containing protein [Methanomassiliicoccales archaeon]
MAKTTAPLVKKEETDPLIRLALRFAEGEISEDEYRKKLAVLKKLHGR